MVEMRNVYRILFGGDQSEDIGVDGKIILKCTLNKLGGCGLDSSDSGEGPVAASCKHGNERCEEFLD
jgi:hypothetical protein